MVDRNEGPQYPATSLGMSNPGRVMANIMRRTRELESGKQSFNSAMELGGGRYRIDAQRPNMMVTQTDPSIKTAAEEWVVGATQDQSTNMWAGIAPQYGPVVTGEQYRAAGYQPQRPGTSGAIESPPNTHRRNVLSPASSATGRQLREPRAAEFADSYGRDRSR